MAKNTVESRLDRETVIQAACAFVDREGIDGLTLAALAAELDRHATSLYNHVDSLDGLKRDVTVRSIGELSDRLWRAVAGKAGVVGLRAIAETYRAYAAEHPGRFGAATTWHARMGRTDEMLAAVEPASEAIHAVLDSFELDPVEVRHASRVYSSALVGFVQTAGLTFTDPPSVDDTFDRLVDLFAVALTKGGWLGAHGA
jgi:AcrR family transcriptional regulator